VLAAARRRAAAGFVVLNVFTKRTDGDAHEFSPEKEKVAAAKAGTTLFSCYFQNNKMKEIECQIGCNYVFFVTSELGGK